MKTNFLLILLCFMAYTGHTQTVDENETTPKVETVAKTKIKIFPNPATSVVNVLGVKNTLKANIAISDIYGNIVLSYHWEIRRNAINIPISTLAPGTYFITIRSKEQQVRTKFYKR